MTDRQIQCFVEVAREMNFSKAAENLFLAQPAVSRHVASLEKELGVALFKREGTRRIKLTEQGQIYYNMFARFIQEFRNTQDLLFAPLHPLKLGYIVGWDASPFLPHVINSCQQETPDFRISLECRGFRDLFKGLEQEDLDIIMTIHEKSGFPEGIQIEPLTNISRYLVYSDFMLPNQEISSPADFYACECFIAADSASKNIKESISQTFAPYGITPELRIAPNWETVFANVENGLGFVLLDEWAQSPSGPHIHKLELPSTHLICLAWREGAGSPEMQLFCKYLREMFTN